MKNHTLCALIRVSILLSFTAGPGFAESPHTATVPMRPYKGGRPIVAVKLNGAGPYDFMMDTGASVTVLDTSLFKELGLRAEGSSRVISTAGVSSQTCSTVKEITMNGLSAQNVTIVSMKSPMAASEYHGVRGILGENFLRHFDILFDNQHRTLTFDAADGLAGSLNGDRMPVTFSSMPENQNEYRPMISVRVLDFGQANMLFDSGATDLVLLQKGNEVNPSGDTRLITVNGTMTCETTRETVYFGTGKKSDVAMVSCHFKTEMPRDKDGILPTAIFKQVFLSHAGSYAIINPAHRAGDIREIAAVTPLPQ